MKKFYLIIICFVLIPGFLFAEVKTEKVTPTASPEPAETSFVMGAGISLMNSYNKGLIEEWFQDVIGDKNRELEVAGGFFYLEAGMSTKITESVIVDVLLDANFHATDHVMWGTYLYFGGRAELVLNPFIMSMKIPIKFKPAKDLDLFIGFTPAMLMGWVTGSYTDAVTDWEFVPSPSFGFAGSLTVQMLFMENMGLSIDAGMRILTCDLAFASNAFDTGYGTPTLSNDEAATVDLGGIFMKAGVFLQI